MAKAKYYQRSDGLFESIRTINGKRVAFRGKTCREVDRKILAYDTKKANGRTVGEIFHDWMEYKEKRVAQSSYEQYNRASKHFVEVFGNLYVNEVKPVQCQRFLDQLAAQGYKYGTAQVQKAIMIQVFRFAVIQGDIDISPAAEVRMPRGLDRKQRDALTPEQIKTVTQCREGDGWLLALALLWTGCRIGELLALTYEDIDRKAGTITINKKLSFLESGTVLDTRTKTSAGMRTIPLLDPLADALPKGRIGLIFHNEDGSYLEDFQMRQIWRRYRETVGLPGHITPHYFRHTFATICYESGIDSKAAASFMGHADERLTAELYTHLSAGKKMAAADKMQAYARTCSAVSL